MLISEGQFKAVVEACIHALTDHGIPVGVRKRLLAHFAPMRAGAIHK